MVHKFVKLIILSLSLSPLLVWGQQRVTIEECYELALKYSTLAERDDISSSVASSQIKESGAAYIPSAALNGLASYQSEVVAIPLPGLDPLNKGQYRMTLDVEQLIWDGGISSTSKDISTSILGVELKRSEVDELNLRDRVSGLFLAAILLDDNSKVANIHIDMIERNIELFSARQRDGVATKSSITKFESELLTAKQYLLEIEYNRLKVVESLSIITGKELTADMEYVLPSESYVEGKESNRPEYQLFDMQRKVVDGRMDLLKSYNRPKMSAFISGGIGLPGLDMLRTSPGWFYIAGVKLSVPLMAWKSTRHKKREFIDNKRLIELQQTDFARQNSIDISSCHLEIEKCEAVVLVDVEIVKKRKEVVDIEEVRLENGVATTNDYIYELNQYKEAMLTQQLNKIKLIQAIIDYKSNIGEI